MISSIQSTDDSSTTLLPPTILTSITKTPERVYMTTLIINNSNARLISYIYYLQNHTDIII